MQIREQIDTCSEAAKAQAVKCSKPLALLYAGNQLQHMTPFKRFGSPLL